MDYSLPGPSVHGLLQARILEWAATPSASRSSWPRDQARVSYVSCIGRWFLDHQHHLGRLYFCTFMLKYRDFIKFILNFVFTRLLHKMQCTSIRMVRFFSLLMILVVTDNHCLDPLTGDLLTYLFDHSGFSTWSTFINRKLLLSILDYCELHFTQWRRQNSFCLFVLARY